MKSLITWYLTLPKFRRIAIQIYLIGVAICIIIGSITVINNAMDITYNELNSNTFENETLPIIIQKMPYRYVSNFTKVQKEKYNNTWVRSYDSQGNLYKLILMKRG